MGRVRIIRAVLHILGGIVPENSVYRTNLLAVTPKLPDNTGGPIAITGPFYIIKMFIGKGRRQANFFQPGA
jgi:hypothetical protein